MFNTVSQNILIAICVLLGAKGSKVEERLLSDLFDTYNPSARPAINESDTVNVTFGLSLAQLVNVLEKSQIIILSVFTRQLWINPILTWDPEKYGGIKQINVDPRKIWRPDIVLYNNADEDKTFGGNLDRLHNRVILNYTGQATWLAPVILKSKCAIDVKYFPFDTQICPLKFGSWTYPKAGLNLINENSTADTDKYSTNSAWYLRSSEAVRSENTYPCCEGQLFPDVTFYIEISRRSLFFVCNLIFPMVIIGMLTLLSFLLPAESGERISLAITLLLAMTVFMLVVAEIIPATSDVIPLVGIYFLASMVEMVVMIIVLCYVMRLYHKEPTDTPMGLWTRRIVLDRFSYILRIRKQEENSRDRKLSNLNANKASHLNNEEIKLIDKFKSTKNHTAWPASKISSLNYLSPHENKFDNNNLRPLNESAIIADKLDVLIQHIKSKDEEDEIKTEWRIVAMTIDRCAFIFFTATFFLTVLGCFSRSPGYVP